MNITDVQQIRPLGDLVIVRRHKTEETDSGFVFRESLQGLQKGTVVAVGRGDLVVYMPPRHGERLVWSPRPMLLNVGDVVLYLEGVGQPLRFVKDRFVTDASDRQYMIMHEIHVSAVLESEDNHDQATHSADALACFMKAFT